MPPEFFIGVATENDTKTGFQELYYMLILDMGWLKTMPKN